ncbi:MAG: hypothetical protein L3J16_02940 [Anaerolineales bacterium]|nr:hypothetical protein [Anaerolineales bacterium]
MSDRAASEKKKKSAGLKIPTEVIVAVLSFLGVGITAYVGYLQSRVPYEFSLKATLTAEARLTRIALSVTPTNKPATVPPTLTATITAIPPTTTPTFTPSMTPTTQGRPNGLRYCINAYLVNVRVGPSTQYAAIGSLTGDDCLYFDASNVEGTWLRIAANQPEAYRDVELGWVYRELLGLQGAVQLPAVTLTPTPTLTPSMTPTVTPTFTPTPLG